jgi:hypothetical protein
VSVRDLLRDAINEKVLARTPLRVTARGLARRPDWSIGLLQGSTPFNLASTGNNPILKACDVPGVRAKFVADPFIIKHLGYWHLFFEVQPFNRPGRIAHAYSSDAQVWDSTGIVLEEDFHLSYPQVFSHHGKYWMIPEARASGTVRLYICEEFPNRWDHYADLLDLALADPTIILWHGKWFMFATERGNTDLLRLFVSDYLARGWAEHPASPVVRDDAERSRCGGPLFAFQGSLFRVAQDGRERYGQRLVAVEVLALSAEEYREGAAIPLKEPGEELWSNLGVHHLHSARVSEGYLAVSDGSGPTRWRHR